MYKRKIETSESPHITVTECRGNLTVTGDAEREITLLVQGEEDDVVLERKGESLSLVLPDDTTLVCPPGTTVTLERVLENLQVVGVEGPIVIGTVHGNAMMRRVGLVSLEEALSNLSARDVAGNLQGRDVKGNARVQNLDGQLTLDQVAGNLTAEGIEGGLRAVDVRGNARLQPPFSSNATYHVNLRGNLAVSIPPDASLRVTIRAGGRVGSDVPGLVLTESDGAYEGVLGAGEATLEADVKGNVAIRSTEAADTFEVGADLEGLGAGIEWQMNEAMAKMATRLEESLGRMDSVHIQRRVEEVTERARRKAEQAAERARMRAERAERRWRRVSGRAERPEKAAATDEERLRVLRMVEGGKLTPEQASELLAALEGE